MPANKAQQGRFGQKKTDASGGLFSVLYRPVFLGLLTFVLLGSVCAILIYQRYLILKEEQRKEVYDIAHRATEKLQQSLAYSLSATKLLSFFVDSDGNVNNFDSVAAQIMSSGNEVDALQLVPGGVIRYIYPAKGNERAIGYNILKDPTRSREAYKAIEKKELYFAGPFELRQGGLGVVGRLPIFRGGTFWGFSAVIIKMPTLLKAAGIDTSGAGGYYYQLSKVNPDTRKEEFFISHKLEKKNAETVSITVPNGEWKLSVTKASSLQDFTDIFWFIGLGVLFSLLGAVFIYHIAQRPQKLDELVRLRTRQLKDSEAKFSKAFHSNLLGLVIYDTDWSIVDVNDPYAALLESTPDQLIGRSSEEAGLISKMPGEKGKFTSDEIREILEEKGYLENYELEIVTRDTETRSLLLSIEPLRIEETKYWLASAVDISGSKKADKLVQESEEKYRNLVEQASDGIVITDLDGIILEVNNSMCQMSGFAEEEFLGQPLTRFLPAEDQESNPLRIQELLQGRSLLYERRLLKKDGSVLDIEVNSKMASSHTLIGFIRDISERKKAERDLQYQSRLLESVSDAITSLDMERRIVSWNRACEELYGFTTEEVIGKRVPELISFEYPDYTREEVFEEVFAKGQWRGEFNFIHPKTNQKVHLLSGISLFKSRKGETIGFIITSRDITDQKKAQQLIAESEKKYRTLVEQASDGIFIADKKGRFLVVNSSGYKMSLYSPEELNSVTIYDLVLPGDLEEMPFNFADMISAKGARSERRMRRKDGTLLDVEITAKFISDDRFLAFVRDISERKKVAEEISVSNERFSMIAKATNDVVWDHDFTINETWGNEGLYKLYGFDSSETKINFEMFIDRVHPDERQGLVDRLNQAIEKGEHVLYEQFHFLSATGEYRTFYDRAYIQYDAAGKPLRMLGAMQDITEREQTEKQILKEKELSDSIINSLPGVFYLYNKEGNFLRWNRNLESVTGYSAEEISRLHPIELFDESEKQLLTEKINSVFTNGYDSVEADFFLKDKRKIPYYFTGQAIEYEGQSCLVGVGFDISEKQKAEKVIRENEKLNRALVEHAPEALVVLDVESGRFTSVSTSATHLFKMTEEELLGTGPIQVSPLRQPDGRTSEEAGGDYIQRAIDGEKPVFEWTHQDKEGNEISCEVWLVRLPAEDRVLIRGSIKDITERKKTEEEILRSKRQFQSLVENISGVYWVNNLDTYETLYISPSYETIWGRSVEELYKDPGAFLEAVHPDDKALLQSAFENLASTRKASLSYRILRPDGSIRWIQVKTNVVEDPKGAKIEYGYAEDITERKQAEEKLQQSEMKYRLLFYNNPLPMWMVTIPDLMIIDVNDAAIKQYGYSREEFLQLSTRDLRPEEDLPNFLSEVRKMEPDRINVRAWRHKKKDGTIIHVETYSHQIIYEGRKVWLGLSHDVTEAHNAKELLQKSYEDIRLLASNLQSIREDERTNIAREIHDELGQQLTGLKMDMHWLNRRINSSDDEVNQKMKESIELINATITTVRKIATELRPSILDDLGLLAALEWQSEEFARRSGIEVLFTNNAGEIRVLPNAATALFRIYQEVLTNVARHSHASRVDALFDSDGKNLYFSIRDNGDGFDVNSTKGKKTLGLLGIKERSLLIGGTYEINSKPGDGSEIRISIPLNLVETSD
ncbi:MAG TPA: PAS domain S-box protein [Ferruginibacter sp.]|nr:PAS domain S-box protein [Ferruginibacter sp.]